VEFSFKIHCQTVSAFLQAGDQPPCQQGIREIAALADGGPDRLVSFFPEAPHS
jgi:hypothetical protein